MKTGNFYAFSSKLSSSTVQARAFGLSSKEDDKRLFDQHRLIQGVYSGIFFPVVFKQDYGKRLEDVLDTGWSSLFLISGRMKTVLEKNNLTGWMIFDIVLLDKHGQEIVNYYGLSITGRCGPLLYSKSEVIEKRLVPNGPLGKYYKGLHIDLDKWDGSDFFLPENNFKIIATNRAAQILYQSKFANIRLENLTEIETPDFALQKA